MKATKLASIFAVTAVAAAVSTTTIAADAVFSGTAGVEYVTSDASNELDGTDVGEIEINVDNGVVFAEIEIATSGADEATTIGMEELYVKQGAVSFGRFDGSVAAGSFMGMDEIGYTGIDSSEGNVDNTGIRYSVTPELTVAVEATEAGTTDVDSEIGFAVSYVADMDGLSFGVSGGSVGDATGINLGVQTSMDALTLSANYGVGTSAADADISEFGIGVEFAATDALTFTLQFANELELEESGTYFIAAYTAGDLTYYVEHYTTSEDTADFYSDQTEIGVTASF